MNTRQNRYLTTRLLVLGLIGEALSLCLVTNITIASEPPATNSLVKRLVESKAKDAEKINLETPLTPSTPVPTGEPLPSPSKDGITPTPSTQAAATAITILDPTPETVVDIPATTVTLQFPKGAQVELLVNGVSVDSKLVGRTETNTKNNTVTQTWYGVGLQDGENTITAQTLVNGVLTKSTPVLVQVRGVPKQITLRALETRIPANGRSTATIEGQLIDASGNRSNRDAIVTIKATAGEFVGTDASAEQPGFQVKVEQGRFQARLRSGLQAQTVRVQVNIGDLDAFTEVVLETDLRSSLVTGVIDLRVGKRGTDFYRSFRDFLPTDKDFSTQVDLHSAVFATGDVGGWLFTGAYNSDRNLNQTCDNVTRLYRDSQFCEQGYPVYGDSSTSEVLTPSQDSIYAKLERTSPNGLGGVDSFLWGDYNSSEFATRSQEFTATTRQLHGFKGNYNFGNLQATAIYGNNLQGFQRDTVVPDGTSGFYFLSRRLLVPGSENVFVELEELNRPGTVLERKALNRGADYEIDYDRGTLLFREPLLRTDVNQIGQVLVRRIVSTYQYESQDNNSLYGARLRYHLNRKGSQESWIGATYLNQTQGVRNFELYGADALISLNPQTNIIAEYARSQNTSDIMGDVGGSAFRLEANTQLFGGVLGRAYYRKTETGFANDATISFVPGQTRYGGQISGAISSSTRFRLQYDHEDNNGIAPRQLNTLEDLIAPRIEALPGARVDNSLTTISAGIQQQIGKATVDVDLLHRDRTDRLTTNLRGTSDQLRSRLNLPLTQKLTFIAQNELSLSNTDAVYPDRTVLGLNWALTPGINLRLGQQFYSRGQYTGQSITSLDLDGEYKLGSDTSLTGRYGILGGANGMTVQGALGLNQRWVISPGLKLDVAYEHVFGGFLGVTGAGKQYIQPYAAGQSASSLGFSGGDSYSAGLEYNGSKNFQASVRYQHRSSSGGSNTVISAGATGKLSPSLTALVRYQQAGSSNLKLSGIDDTANLKVGIAYRDPSNDKFNALLRYEYRKNPSTIPDTIFIGSGTGSEDHTFAAEGIYAPSWQWEFYGKYALRNSTTFLASDLVGTSTVSLSQLRATYRLGYSMDLVGEVRWISQPAVNFSETGFLLEAGYYLTPNLRLAGGYSFGRVSDRDFDGSRSDGGFYFGLTVKLNELFNGFGLQKPIPAKPESQVKKNTTTSASTNPLTSRLSKVLHHEKSN